MKYWAPFLFAIAMICAIHPARATQPHSSSLSLESHISTLGPGFDILYSHNDSITLRLEHNGYRMRQHGNNYQSSNQELFAKYDGLLQLKTTGFLMDYYPSPDSGFFLSSGLYLNQNQIKTKATLKEKETNILGWHFDSSEPAQVDGRFHFQRVSPYLGMGYRTKSSNTWRFNVGLGVLFQGPITGKGDITTTQPSRLNKNLHYLSDSAAKQVENEVNRHHYVQYYPVVSVGISYHFW